MDTQTIDQEFEKLQTEFQDVAATVKVLADKMKQAAASGDGNAGEWLTDLEQVAKDIDDEQDQAHALLLAIHGYITSAVAAGSAGGSDPEHPPLYAPGQEPAAADPSQQPQRQGLFGGMGGGMMGGGMMGGGMMGGGMMGGYGMGGFARAMEFGAGMSIGSSLVRGIFR